MTEGDESTNKAPSSPGASSSKRSLFERCWSAWPWGQRARTHVDELSAVCTSMERHGIRTHRLAVRAKDHLSAAGKMLAENPLPWARADIIREVEAKLNAARHFITKISQEGQPAEQWPEDEVGIRGNPFINTFWRNWGHRSRTHLDGLTGTCTVMEHYGHHTQQLAGEAQKCLGAATEALETNPLLWGRAGVIDRVETKMNAARCLIVEMMPSERIAGHLPEIAAVVRGKLIATDPRRIAVETIITNHSTKKHPITPAERESLVSALRESYCEREREFERVRTFRNSVWTWSIIVLLAAVVLGLHGTMADLPKTLGWCFEGGIGAWPTRTECHGSSNRIGFLTVELFGLLAAVVAAAFSIRGIRGTSGPYRVSVALVVLKLVSGALTAIAGLIVVDAVRLHLGEDPLGTPALMLTLAMVFGYSQQLFTHLVDQRGAQVMEATRSPSSHEATMHAGELKSLSA